MVLARLFERKRTGITGERGENRVDERKRRSVSTYIASLRCVLGYWVSF